MDLLLLLELRSHGYPFWRDPCRRPVNDNLNPLLTGLSYYALQDGFVISSNHAATQIPNYF
jgi:hypothetical protein